MKIKHKNLGVELEVEIPSVRPFISNYLAYYQTKGGSYIAHEDPDWEPVKEEWKEVTNQLVVQDKYDDNTMAYIDGNNVIRTAPGYRLKVVQANVYDSDKINSCKSGIALILMEKQK